MPVHRVSFNGIVDLPVGKGKRFLGNTNRLVNACWAATRSAFTGTVVSQAFQVAAANWGATSPMKMYKDQAPITDCRSGVCRAAYLWFNGYLSPTVINAAKNGVSGASFGLHAVPGSDQQHAGATNFGNNNVSVPLNNGKSG